MSLEFVSVLLVAYREDGKAIKKKDYSKWIKLGKTNYDLSGFDTDGVDLGIEFELGEFDGKHKDAQLRAAAEKALIEFALFLSQQSRQKFDSFRASGVRLEFAVSLWLKGKQFELNFPFELLAELGRLQLPIELVSD